MPIAIVGRGCVLPGATSPAELWRRLRGGDDLLSPPPIGSWPMSSERITLDATGVRWSDRGGYVRDFDFDPTGFAVDAQELLQADRCAHWVLEAARQALHEAGHDAAAGHRRTGAILGNLSLPTPSQVQFAVAAWTRRWAHEQGLAGIIDQLDAAPVAPGNRYMSAMPTRLLARSLGLGGEAFTLDAACASSLYALKLACDALEDGRADLMLAGACCGTDPMFLHIGFRALKALSPTGQSRPFHRDANGLVPSEGAVVLALRRLHDAQAAGDRILGVIRGIGLSNDGGAAGLLTPASSGQVRAIRQALLRAELQPADVAMLECHATGTPVGDGVELASIAAAYAAAGCMPIGSLKSQIGHLLTVSGAAGILKVLGAFEAGVLPPSMPVRETLDALAKAPVRLLETEEPWPTHARRIAAVSSFGFGGNNAHVILEAYEPGHRGTHHAVRVPPVCAPAPAPLAIVGLGVVCAHAQNTAEFTSSLLDGAQAFTEVPDIGPCGLAKPFTLAAAEIKFPPRDLADSLPQQVILLKVASEALATVRSLPQERTGVLTGMECDVEIARQLARSLVPARLHDWAQSAGVTVDPDWLQHARDAFAGPLKASVVTGSLPNIVANRLNAQFKLAGLGYSVCADELSGLRALDIAARALRRGELDAAVVGAVDLCCESATARAAESLEGVGRERTGDAAVVMVLKRLDDATRDGEQVLALIEGESNADDAAATDAPASARLALGDGPGSLHLTERYGHAHAASGLLHLAAAVIATRHGAWLGAGPATPWLAPAAQRKARVSMHAQGGHQFHIDVQASPHEASGPPPGTRIERAWCFAASDREGLRQALAAGRTGGHGPVRLAFVAAPGADFERQSASALACLANPAAATATADIALCDGPLGGEVAAVFTAAGAAYPGMGRELMLASPRAVASASARLGNVRAACDWIFDPARGPSTASAASVSPLEQLAGSSLLSQVHAQLSMQVLQLRPHAAIGLSSGETNAVVALGAWDSVDGLFDGLAPIYANGLGGRFELLQSAWQQPEAQWAAWTIALPPERVREALRDERHAYLTMIYGPAACAIGGERGAVGRVIDKLGGSYATRIDHDVAVHCPEVLHVRDTWRSLHHRSTRALADLRFYTAAACGTYPAESDRIADALLEMASGPVDFHSMIERAWQDGIRVFVEHGPRSLCTRWIADILGDRPHLALAYDAHPNRSVRSALLVGARLWAAGVTVDVEAMNAQLTDASCVTPNPGSGVRFASHMPPIALPPWPQRQDERATAPSTANISSRNATVLPPESDMNALVRSSAMVRPAETTAPEPLWTRADLEEMSHGQLSRFFGPKFEPQDGHARQVRMPMPPLLLADRVMEIEGEAGGMGLGRIVTETDVTADAWYLHEGSMPAGLEVEAGQADLLLISYLGADLLNRGERVYRLLGCEMTFHGERRPRVGDTLRYEIEVTGHANTGEVRLFFFRYDSFLNGEPRLSVRNGRAGFFTEQELKNAGGVIWNPATDLPDASIQHHQAPPTQTARSYSAEQVRALADGRAYDCFGAGFEAVAAHHRTPRIQEGPMQLFQQVEQLDPHGGPWGRGTLRATYDIRGDEWFFPGHFKNDPTMPGTLMCEAGFQMMSFYLAALGHTRERDGWSFELVPSVTFKAVCRGQVVPTSRRMSYEIFVRGLEEGTCPTLWADVLLTVDGRKAFHGRNLGVRLVPSVPLEHAIAPAPAAGARPAARIDGFTFDGAAMLHCATGLPSRAFGPLFARFDGARNLPRLPSPPYQFMSRVTRCAGPLGGMQVGSEVDSEYDIPDDAWYFDDNDSRTMAFAVLLEAALQPCGWLATYMGVPLHCDTDLSFRNLDGEGTLHRSVFRGDGILRTTARCTSLARNGDIFIESFDVRCVIGDAPVYTLKTVFGHFTTQALSEQKGLPATAAERTAMQAAQGRQVDLRAAGNSMELPRLARGNLLMLDRVTGDWPQGGAAKRGRLQAEFDVDPNAWFFKAHFYRDPVQPGSLGIEAMIQLLQFTMRDRGLAAGMRAPRFEPLAVGRAMAWKYRGQVLPRNRKVSVEMEIADEGRDERGPWVSANVWLWVDGLRIYHARNLAVRIVEGG
ncbi:beta-ketoacyl synthase N-terminal-like domain-containing protein [Ramlibacter sp. AN1015]|uniref:beta-ketoacyl synthase N-terminal-like domain-containing protein n=1 Tax=Ramlibacter sp. AN1015 TaxID=3133428 RepID=UPI0030C4A705